MPSRKDEEEGVHAENGGISSVEGTRAGRSVLSFDEAVGGVEGLHEIIKHTIRPWKY